MPHRAEVAQVALVAHEHDYNIVVRVVPAAQARQQGSPTVLARAGLIYRAL